MQPAATPDYGLIFSYGIQMTIVFFVALGIYTVSVLRTKPDMIVWFTANGLRIGICLGLFWFIGAGLVMVPNFASILGSFGFNADQSAAGIALVIAGFVMSGKTDTKLKVEVTSPDDVPPDGK